MRTRKGRRRKNRVTIKNREKEIVPTCSFSSISITSRQKKKTDELCERKKTKKRKRKKKNKYVLVDSLDVVLNEKDKHNDTTKWSYM